MREFLEMQAAGFVDDLPTSSAAQDARAATQVEVDRFEYLCRKFKCRKLELYGMDVPEDSPQPDKPKEESRVSKLERERDDYLQKRFLPHQTRLEFKSVASVANKARVFSVEVKL